MGIIIWVINLRHKHSIMLLYDRFKGGDQLFSDVVVIYKFLRTKGDILGIQIYLTFYAHLNLMQQCCVFNNILQVTLLYLCAQA